MSTPPLRRRLAGLILSLPMALCAGCFGDAGGLGAERDAQSDAARDADEVLSDVDLQPLDSEPPVADTEPPLEDVTADTDPPPADVVGPLGPAPVLLRTAGNYAVLAKSAIANVPTSAITGVLAISPAAASLITGFPLTRAGTHWTCPEVSGGVFAADNDPPTPADLTAAVSDMEAAYTDAAGRTTPAFRDLADGDIAGFTFTPNLYRWTSSVKIVSDITISGAPDDVWIFQVTGGLAMSADAHVILTGGARAKNVFWQVAGGVTLGARAHAEGIVLCATSIELATGASIHGRLLAQTSIGIAASTVVAPAP